MWLVWLWWCCCCYVAGAVSVVGGVWWWLNQKEDVKPDDKVMYILITFHSQSNVLSELPDNEIIEK